jgi:hypothetical protein
MPSIVSWQWFVPITNGGNEVGEVAVCANPTPSNAGDGPEVHLRESRKRIKLGKF